MSSGRGHARRNAAHVRELPGQFTSKPVCEASEQATATGEDDVPEEDLAKVQVAMVD